MLARNISNVHQRWMISIAMIVMLFPAGVMQTAAEDYLVYEDWGGTYCDAEKSDADPDDDLMCWAATASNVLEWTGWGFVPQRQFTGTDQIFGHYKACWTNHGGGPTAAWRWWFDGTAPPTSSESQLTEAGKQSGGFWAGTYTWNEYGSFWGSEYGELHTPPDYSQAMCEMERYLRQGYGVGLAIAVDGHDSGHELTCWGYSKEGSGQYDAIYVTDSDDSRKEADPPDTRAEYSATQRDNKWFLDGYFGRDDYYIIGIHALRKKEIHVDGGKVFRIDESNAPFEDLRAFADLHVGFAGNGSVVQTGGYNPVRGTMTLGHEPGATGNYDLSATSVLRVEHDEVIGNSGQGYFTHSGGEHGVAQTLYLGKHSGAMGSYDLSATSVLRVYHDEFIGHAGEGYFTHSGGVHTVYDTLYLGRESGSKGCYELSGSSSLDVGLDEFVGHSGEGYFTQHAGTHSVGETLYLGRDAGSKGAYELHNGELSSRNEIIGYGGEGYFTQKGGTHSVTGNITLAKEAGSIGRYTLVGGTLNVSGSITTGSGDGALVVDGGTYIQDGTCAIPVKGDSGHIKWASDGWGWSPVRITGPVEIGTACTLDIVGDVSMEDTGSLVNHGHVSHTGSLARANVVNAAGGHYIFKGFLDETSFTNAAGGHFEWHRGGLADGTVLRNLSEDFVISGVRWETLESGASVLNEGTITASQTLELGDECSITNSQGALFDLRTDACLYGGEYYDDSSVNNAGTFRKSAGAGTSDIALPFRNTGTVEVTNGTMAFRAGGISQDGRFVVDDGATIEFAVSRLGFGSFQFSGVNRIEGDGNVVLEMTSSSQYLVAQAESCTFESTSDVRLQLIGDYGPAHLVAVQE
ncbi:MAG: hypothetical protein ACOC8H_01835 [bacterium]